MFNLIYLVFAFPLIGLAINAFCGRWLDEKWIGIIGSGAVAASFMVAVLQVISLPYYGFQFETVTLANWIISGELNVPWQVRVDTLSVTMMMLVTGVGTLIHIYAVGYMHGDARFARFFIYLNLFVVSMLVLVLGDNYLMMFVGWEGVGLCSYLLIGFWFDRDAAGSVSNPGNQEGSGNARAGKKAFVVNRIGDLGFLIAIFLMFTSVGSLDFTDVFHFFQEHGVSVSGLATAITLMLLVGAIGKSAQVPLFIWLPDAMAGPTPVSALIHAATMVTAGVYMIARSAPIFDLAPVAQISAAMIGATTAFMAGTIAISQWDIKRVLAYSTISQLGFMVAAIGLGGYVAGIFHLLTHGFFKALLFLSAGSVIHGIEHGARDIDDHVDAQDMRIMGGLRSKMKITFWAYLVGSLALAGIFPLAGFWSKDEIMTDAWHVGVVEGHWHGVAIYILLALSAMFTAFYMTRQIVLIFFGRPRSKVVAHAHESPPAMVIPLAILSGLTVFGGALNLPGHHMLGNWLEHTHHFFHSVDFDPVVAVSSTVLALAGVGLGYLVYYRRPLESSTVSDPLRSVIGSIFDFLYGKWYVDELYARVVIRPYKVVSVFLAYTVDGRFWHDFFHDSVVSRSFQGVALVLSGPVDKGILDSFFDGLASFTRIVAVRVLSPLQTGFVRNYALTVLLGVVGTVGYLLVR